MHPRCSKCPSQWTFTFCNFLLSQIVKDHISSVSCSLMPHSIHPHPSQVLYWYCQGIQCFCLLYGGYIGPPGDSLRRYCGKTSYSTFNHLFNTPSVTDNSNAACTFCSVSVNGILLCGQSVLVGWLVLAGLGFLSDPGIPGVRSMGPSVCN